MKPSPLNYASLLDSFPWLQALGWIVLAVGGAFFVDWIQWVGKFRKPQWSKCPRHNEPLIEGNHYYGPAWWKGTFDLSVVTYWPRWGYELHQRYPCAKYGYSEKEREEGTLLVRERFCPLCTQEYDAEHYKRLMEEYGRDRANNLFSPPKDNG